MPCSSFKMSITWTRLLILCDVTKIMPGAGTTTAVALSLLGVQAAGALCNAAIRKPSPARSQRFPNPASQMRVALPNIALEDRFELPLGATDRLQHLGRRRLPLQRHWQGRVHALRASSVSSRARAFSSSSSDWGMRIWSTGSSAFVLLERSLVDHAFRSSPPCETRLPRRHSHSITSSARASSVGGTSRPSALAVLRLITNSYLVGA